MTKLSCVAYGQDLDDSTLIQLYSEGIGKASLPFIFFANINSSDRYTFLFLLCDVEEYLPLQS